MESYWETNQNAEVLMNTFDPGSFTRTIVVQICGNLIVSLHSSNLSNLTNIEPIHTRSGQHLCCCWREE